MRIFIALELNENAIEEIKRIQKIIKKENEKKNFFYGKFTEPQNLHLTLKFLDEIEEKEIQKIDFLLNEIKMKSFYAEINEIGVFSKNFIKIIWLKLEGEKVFELQKEIDHKLADLFEPERRFMSHITIARIKKVNDKNGLLKFLNDLKINKTNFQVKKFFLKKSELFSEGPFYETLKEYYLLN